MSDDGEVQSHNHHQPHTPPLDNQLNLVPPSSRPPPTSSLSQNSSSPPSHPNHAPRFSDLSLISSSSEDNSALYHLVASKCQSKDADYSSLANSNPNPKKKKKTRNKQNKQNKCGVEILKPTPPEDDHDHQPPIRKKKKKTHYTHRPQYSQYTYLRSHTRIYVKDPQTISLPLSDPDAPVEWSAVVKLDVIIDTTKDDSRCPICLDDVYVAPRVAKCGHVFCWPCIVQYLAWCADPPPTIPPLPSHIILGSNEAADFIKKQEEIVQNKLQISSKLRSKQELLSTVVGPHHGIKPLDNGSYPPQPTSRRCPLCNDHIARPDLRPAKIQKVSSTVTHNQTHISFVLTQKSPFRPPQIPSKSNESLPSDDTLGLQFSRLALATPESVYRQRLEDRAQLLTKRADLIIDQEAETAIIQDSSNSTELLCLDVCLETLRIEQEQDSTFIEKGLVDLGDLHDDYSKAVRVLKLSAADCPRDLTFVKSHEVRRNAEILLAFALAEEANKQVKSAHIQAQTAHSDTDVSLLGRARLSNLGEIYFPEGSLVEYLQSGYDPERVNFGQKVSEALSSLDEAEQRSIDLVSLRKEDDGIYRDCKFIYQVPSGEYIYLHPFFMRSLLTNYGNLRGLLPLSLDKLPITHVEHLSLDWEARQRFGFLQHLPLGTNVTFVSCDIRGLLSGRTKALFREEFMRRESRIASEKERQKKEELRVQRKAERAEREAYEELVRSGQIDDFETYEQEREKMRYTVENFPFLPGAETGGERKEKAGEWAARLGGGEEVETVGLEDLEAALKMKKKGRRMK